MIVIALNNEGTTNEKPSADFAKLLEAVPNRTASNKKMYGIRIFIFLDN
tara:strand:- start:990 stop:1136 length:147 start_codon:yes stop_codon:yes gene_type:complete